MSALRKFDYFLVRYVPNVVREGFANIGLVMTENDVESGGFSGMHFTRDWREVRRIDPAADIEILEALGREMEGRFSEDESRADLLRRMTDSWSNVIQLSPIRHCLAEDPARELKTLAMQLVEAPRIEWPETFEKQTGKKWIYSGMSEAFRSKGVWDLLEKRIPAKPYANDADDFTFDCGYAVGNEIKLFHAVSLVEIGAESRMFPLRVAKIAPKMAMLRQQTPRFTAVVEDGYDETDDVVKNVIAFMKDEEIRVARLREMPEIAERARVELRV